MHGITHYIAAGKLLKPVQLALQYETCSGVLKNARVADDDCHASRRTCEETHWSAIAQLSQDATC